MSMNVVILQGRMCADPEVSSPKEGLTVARFAIAVDRDNKKEDGSRDTDFVNCVAWNGTARLLQSYFPKGRMILAHGRLVVRKWVDKEGNKRTTTEVLVNNVYFCGDGKKDGSAAPQQQLPPAPTEPSVSTSGIDPNGRNWQVLDEVDDPNLPF